MTKLSENTIEISLIEQLRKQGFTHYNSTDISTISEKPEREQWNSVILEKQLNAASSF